MATQAPGVHMDVIGLAAESPDAAGFEAALLRALEREVGFDAAFFVTEDLVRPTTMRLDPNALARAFAAPQRYDRELAPVKHQALAGSGVAVDTAVLGERRVRATRYHREFAASMGGRHSLFSYPRLRGQVLGALMLGRCGGAFNPREVRLLEALLPAIAVARASFGICAPREQPLPPAPPPPSLVARLRKGARELACVRAGELELRVLDCDGYRELLARRGNEEMSWSRAGLSRPSESGWPYVDLFHMAATLAGGRRRALFIGCGGAVALRQFARVYPGIALDLVEREHAVVEIARAWYALGAIPNLSIHVEDGSTFIARSEPDRWDVVIVDAYGAGDLPAELTGRAFFANVRRVLRAGGALAFNAVGSLDGGGQVSTVASAAGEELVGVRLLPVVELDEPYAASAPRNVVVLARNPRRDEGNS